MVGIVQRRILFLLSNKPLTFKELVGRYLLKYFKEYNMVNPQWYRNLVLNSLYPLRKRGYVLFGNKKRNKLYSLTNLGLKIINENNFRNIGELEINE